MVKRTALLAALVLAGSAVASAVGGALPANAAHLPRAVLHGTAGLLPPTDVTGQGANRKVTLSWTAPSSATPAVDGYDIRETHDGGAWNFVTTVAATPTSATITKLINGTAYKFELRSRSGDNQSNWSLPSPPVTPLAMDASALTAPVSRTVPFGTTVQFTTTLTDMVTGEPIAHQTVNLLSRVGTSGQFGKAGTGTTNAHGRVTVPFTPNMNRQYHWHYTGAPGHHPATSNIATVNVSQIVTAAATKASVAKGGSVKVWGTVVPNEDGKAVVLELRSGGSWLKKSDTTIHRQPLPNGTTAKGFVFKLTLRRKGTAVLRVLRPATQSNAKGVSHHIQVDVT
jgi:hypothetical protein